MAKESVATIEKPVKHRTPSKYFIVTVAPDGTMTDATRDDENPNGLSFTDTVHAKSHIRDKAMDGTFQIMAHKATVVAEKQVVTKSVLK